MRRLWMLSLGIVGLGAWARATTIDCGPPQITFTGGAGSSSFSCPMLDAGVGNVLGNVAYQIGADYFGGLEGSSNIVTFNFSPSGAGSIFGEHTIVVSGIGGSSLCELDGTTACTYLVPFTAATVDVNAETLAAFTVTVSSTLTSGLVGSSEVDPTLVYSATGVPEPGAAISLAGALVGLGILRRRRRAGQEPAPLCRD